MKNHHSDPIEVANLNVSNLKSETTRAAETWYHYRGEVDTCGRNTGSRRRSIWGELTDNLEKGEY